MAAQAHTLTRSAHSLATSPSGVVSCQVGEGCALSWLCHVLLFAGNALQFALSKLEWLQALTQGVAAAGIVRSTKMTRTIIVRRNYAHFIKKYARSAGR